MNRIYRLKFSRKLQQLIAVAEISTSTSKNSLTAPAKLIVTLLASLLAPIALAAPDLDKIVAGEVSINNQESITTIINNSNKAIVEWKDFSIDTGELVKFIQSSNAAILNRVTGTAISQLQGTLQAQGSVFLINPNGIMIGKDAVINAGSFVASTLNTANEEFLSAANKNTFIGQSSFGEVINNGSITVAKDGTVALVGKNVENNGVITAPNGAVMLLAGHSITITDIANPAIAYTITALAQDVDVQQALKGRVISTGSIDTSFEDEKGQIHLFGSNTLVNGKLTAPSIEVLATNQVIIGKQAELDASVSKGGQIYIGGDEQGKGTKQLAQYTRVNDGAKIQTNNGGRIIAWGNSADYSGTWVAKNKGFIETSAYQLGIGANIKVDQDGGEWLIDPYELTVENNTVSNVPTNVSEDTGKVFGNLSADTGNKAISTNTINAALNTGNVTLKTFGGNITFNAGAIVGINATATKNATLTIDVSNTTQQVGGHNVIFQNGSGITDNTSNTYNLSVNILSGSGDNSASPQGNLTAGNSAINVKGDVLIKGFNNVTLTNHAVETAGVYINASTVSFVNINNFSLTNGSLIASKGFSFKGNETAGVVNNATSFVLNGTLSAGNVEISAGSVELKKDLISTGNVAIVSAKALDIKQNIAGSSINITAAQLNITAIAGNSTLNATSAGITLKVDNSTTGYTGNNDLNITGNIVAVGDISAISEGNISTSGAINSTTGCVTLAGKVLTNIATGTTISAVKNKTVTIGYENTAEAALGSHFGNTTVSVELGNTTNQLPFDLHLYGHNVTLSKVVNIAGSFDAEANQAISIKDNLTSGSSINLMAKTVTSEERKTIQAEKDIEIIQHPTSNSGNDKIELAGNTTSTNGTVAIEAIGNASAAHVTAQFINITAGHINITGDLNATNASLGGVSLTATAQKINTTTNSIGTINVAGNVTSANGVSIVANSTLANAANNTINVTLGGNITAVKGDIKITANGTVSTATGKLVNAAAGNITLAAQTNTSVASHLNATGLITLGVEGKGNVTVNSSLNQAGAINNILIQGQGATLDNLTATGNLTVNIVTSKLNITKAITANSVNLAAQDIETHAEINATGALADNQAILLTAQGNVTLNSSLVAGADKARITIKAENTINTAAAITVAANGTIEIDGAKAINLGNGTALNAIGTNATISIGNLADAKGNVSISSNLTNSNISVLSISAGNLTVSNIIGANSTTAININTTGATVLNQTLNASSVTIKAGSVTSNDSGAVIAANGSITINALTTGTGNVTLGEKLNATGKIEINAANTTTVTKEVAAAAINVTAAEINLSGNLTAVNSASQANHGITIAATKEINLSGVVNSSAAVNISSPAHKVNISNNITAQTIKINSGSFNSTGNITAVGNDSGDTKAITITATKGTDTTNASGVINISQTLNASNGSILLAGNASTIINALLHAKEQVILGDETQGKVELTKAIAATNIKDLSIRGQSFNTTENISVGGNISISTKGTTNISKQINATDINITSGVVEINKIENNYTLNSAKGIIVATNSGSAGNITITGNLTATTGINVSATGVSTVANANLTTGVNTAISFAGKAGTNVATGTNFLFGSNGVNNSVTIGSTTGNTTIAAELGNSTTAANYSLVLQGNVAQLSNHINITGDLEVNTLGLVNISNNLSANTINITAGEINASEASLTAINAAGAALGINVATSAGDIKLANITSNTGITVIAKGNATIAGNITTSAQDINLSAAANLTTVGMINAAAGNVSIMADNANITSEIQATENLSLVVTNSTELNSVVTAKGISFTTGSLSANGSSEVNATAGKIEINATTGGINFQGKEINATKGITILAAKGAINITAPITGEKIEITGAQVAAGDSITATGATAQDSITIIATGNDETAGTVNLSGEVVTTANSSVTITGASNVTIAANITANSGVAITSTAGSVNIANHNISTTTGNIAVQAKTDITLSSNITHVNGNVLIGNTSTTGEVVIAQNLTAKELEITGGEVKLNSDLNATGGNISVNATGELNTNGSLNATMVNVIAGSFSSNEAGVINATNINIQATNATGVNNIQGELNATAQGAITINVAGELNLNSAAIAKTVNFSGATVNSNVAGTVNATDSINIQATNVAGTNTIAGKLETNATTINVAGSFNLNGEITANTATITAGSISSNATGSINTTDSISITATNQANSNNLLGTINSSGGNITIDTAGELNVNASINAQDKLELASEVATNINAAINTTANGAIVLGKTGTGTVNINHNISDSQSITIKANDAVVNGEINVTGEVAINTTNSINVSKKVTANQINLASSNIVVNNQSTGVETLGATGNTTVAAIVIEGKGNVTISGGIYSAQGVSINGSNVTSTANITANQGEIKIVGTTGLNISSGKIESRQGSIELGEANIGEVSIVGDANLQAAHNITVLAQNAEIKANNGVAINATGTVSVATRGNLITAANITGATISLIGAESTSVESGTYTSTTKQAIVIGGGPGAVNINHDKAKFIPNAEDRSLKTDTTAVNDLLNYIPELDRNNVAEETPVTNPTILLSSSLPGATLLDPEAGLFVFDQGQTYSLNGLPSKSVVCVGGVCEDTTSSKQK